MGIFIGTDKHAVLHTKNPPLGLSGIQQQNACIYGMHLSKMYQKSHLCNYFPFSKRNEKMLLITLPWHEVQGRVHGGPGVPAQGQADARHAQAHQQRGGSVLLRAEMNQYNFT